MKLKQVVLMKERQYGDTLTVSRNVLLILFVCYFNRKTTNNPRSLPQLNLIIKSDTVLVFNLLWRNTDISHIEPFCALRDGRCLREVTLLGYQFY